MKTNNHIDSNKELQELAQKWIDSHIDYREAEINNTVEYHQQTTELWAETLDKLYSNF